MIFIFKKALQRAVPVILLFVLTACSGGGGGGGGSSGGSFLLSTNTLTFTASVGGSTPASQTFEVIPNEASTPIPTFTVIGSGVVSPVDSTFNSSNNIEVTVVPVNPNTLGVGTNTTTIVVDNGRLVRNVTVTYVVSNAAPKVNFVAPYIALAGETKPVIIRGSGFSRFTTAAVTPTVQFGGIAATGVTVTNDTEIRATPPALTAGRYAVSVLGVADVFVSRASLLVIDPPVYARTAISVGGIVASRMIYDAERRSLLVANLTNSRIDRYSYQSGTTWVATNGAGIPSLNDMAMSPDGASLVALSGGAMWTTDPAGTLVSGTTSYPTPEPFNPGRIFRKIAFLNDGQAVLMSNTQWAYFYFYQILDGSNKSSINLYGYPTGSLYSGVIWGLPNGSRVLVSEGGSGARIFNINASNLTFTYNIPTVVPFGAFGAVHSRDGSIAIINGTMVTNGSYVNLGTLPASDAQVVTWDGSLAYTYTVATRRIRAFSLNSPNGSGGFTELALGVTSTLDLTTEDPGVLVNAMEISPDGGTLFIGGYNRIVVVPISSL